ncbi:Aste57867_14004 [Aphanomyces stellatus]|uniref:Aste57867_14004 protein n=1 Tax=Aphanomyces stellatus TaxID=120398 RepID=A0A485KZL4_9STRA|nr:hypothetical protein As57867_013953 [Aphanomyces stellatus]VFT90834.1 Aste57867_14004 [Aphanomyces stellatus]
MGSATRAIWTMTHLETTPHATPDDSPQATQTSSTVVSDADLLAYQADVDAAAAKWLEAVLRRGRPVGEYELICEAAQKPCSWFADVTAAMARTGCVERVQDASGFDAWQVSSGAPPPDVECSELAEGAVVPDIAAFARHAARAAAAASTDQWDKVVSRSDL